MPVKRRVFVVDDESVVATTLAAVLRIGGFDSKSFSSPLAALEAAPLEMPDLLLSDVVMPEMSGIELAIRFKSLLPKSDVLLISGQASVDDLLYRARNAGHDFQILAKPVHPEFLFSQIRELLAKSDAARTFANGGLHQQS